jgi:glycosyltransferase involved in cell wall biosynthesis
MKKKIILSVAGFFPEAFGGGQVYVYNLAKELQKRGHNVIILTSAAWEDGYNTYNIKRYEYDGLSVIGVDLNPDVIIEEDKYSELSPMLLKALNTLLKDLNPDLVHLNGLKPALIKICNQLNIPYLVTAHHPGVACPNATLLRPDESLCDKPANPNWCIPCCSRWRVVGAPFSSVTGFLLGHIPKWIYNLAGEIDRKYKKAPYLVRALRYPRLVEKSMEGDRVILNECRYIISPSRAMKELLVRNGVSPEKIFFLHHGIDPLPRLPIEPLNGRPVKFGFIGSFGIPKGLNVLIKALEMVSNQDKCELHIYGGGIGKSNNSYLEKCLKRYKAKANIVNHGYIPNDKIIDAYKSIDVLVVPSIYLEVFGLIILEAFSAGRPVIVSKSGGPEELVRDGVEGFIVERNNSKSLAEAMQNFIENPNLILEMSNQIPSVKTIQQYTDEIEELYKNILCSA